MADVAKIMVRRCSFEKTFPPTAIFIDLTAHFHCGVARWNFPSTPFTLQSPCIARQLKHHMCWSSAFSSKDSTPLESLGLRPSDNFVSALQLLLPRPWCCWSIPLQPIYKVHDQPCNFSPPILGLDMLWFAFIVIWFVSFAVR